MSNITKIRAFTVSVVCVFTLCSVISHAGVVGSKHDLSGDSGSSAFQFRSFGQVCVFCHTPHGANTAEVTSGKIGNASGYLGGGTPLLLWNRSLAVLNSGAVYQLYQGYNMVSEPDEVRIYSLLCLSCHDGVSALNVLYNYPGTYDPPGPLAPQEIPDGPLRLSDVFYNSAGTGWGPNIGERKDTDATEDINLRNDHPISFDYPTDGADAGLQTFNDVVTDGRLKFFNNGAGDIMSIECPTCHNVHEEGDSNANTKPFLRVTLDNSEMCTTCHLK